MNTSLVVRTFALVLVSGVVGVGCFSSSSASSPGAGGGSDAAPTSDAPTSSCAPLADGQCNDVQSAGSTTVTGTCGTGAQPQGSGGTIAAGTYFLTGQARYIDSGCSPDSFQSVMLVTAGCMQRVDVSQGTTLAENSAFTTSGAELTRTSTCGGSLPAATYTATDQELVIFDEGGSVTTWTKQP
jgi:hypothetical protein